MPSVIVSVSFPPDPCHAKVVRQAFGAPGVAARLRARAEDRKAHTSDRTRDPAAVLNELLEGLIRDALDIHAHTLDQLLERSVGQREAPLRVRERDDHPVPLAVPDPGAAGGDCSQRL